MANEIDLVVGKGVEGQIKKLMTELTEVDNKIQDIGRSAVAMNTALGVKDTASLTKLTAENEKLNKKIQELTGSSTVLETKLANLAAAQARATKAATDASIAEEKLITATNKNTTATEKKTKAITEETIAQREANKQATVNATINNEQVGAYKRLEAQYQKTAQKALDLGAANKQNTEEYKRLVKESQELGQRLKSVDSDVGKHTRNVGNYASSWNGLGNSINQLTREAPAFANSVQTGFMALSNNIPILTDELGVLIAKNKALQESGKPTESILKTVAGAFFSWQTAISLGVTILTVYGAKIWEAAFGLSEFEKRQKDLNKSMIEAKSTITSDMILMKEYVTIINSSTESEKNKKLAYDEVKKVLPGMTSMTYSQAIATGELTKATDIYISSLIKQKVVELESADIAKQQTELNKKMSMTTEERLGFWDKVIVKYTAQGVSMADMRRRQEKEDKAEQANIDAKMKKLIKSTEEELNIKDKLAQYITPPKKTGTDKSAEDTSKAEEERLNRDYETLLSNLERQKKIDKDSLDSFNGTVEEKTKLSIRLAQDEIDIANVVFEEKKRLAKGDVQLIQQANNEKKTAEENAQQENLKRVTKYYEDRENLAKEYAKKISDFNMLDSVEYKKYLADKKKEDEDRKKYLEKTLDELRNYSESFSSEFASNLGFKETFDFFAKVDSEGNTMWQKLDQDGISSQEKFKARFNAIAESSQEMFNKIAEYSMANYEQEYARLEAQKEISLKFAGDSTAAKEKIEADYAKKKKEIDKRRFEDEKKITMVNIVIDTAQAVVATLAKGAGFFSSPLAMIVAAMGAAQLGMVAAQQFPAYAEGTDNHSGGLMLVNDGVGSNFQEKVILPSGKVIRPQGRNVLMDAPKGTKVLNHEQQLFEMLQSNNISFLPQQSNGMTPEEMDEILGKHFSNIKTQNTIFDRNGFQSYVKNGNSITRSNSNRSQAIGISV